MDISLRIRKKSGTPPYRQIIEGITELILAGELQPGNRLPAERKLAEELGVARGTVKRAYEGLAGNSIIETSHGRGTFVSYRQNIMPTNRKERAVRVINDALEELDGLKFSHREIRSLFELAALEREDRLQGIVVATVDCNPESLYIYQRQLGFLSRIQTVKILLDTIRDDPDPASRLAPFDLILTTSTHYSELLGLVPELYEKLMQVVVSPSQGAIVELAKLTHRRKVGVICQSRAFLEIVKARLRDLRLGSLEIGHCFGDDEAAVADFVAGRDVLILPPLGSVRQKPGVAAALRQFAGRGGQAIRFDYEIERGSLLHVEERIKTLLQA